MGQQSHVLLQQYTRNLTGIEYAKNFQAFDHINKATSRLDTDV